MTTSDSTSKSDKVYNFYYSQERSDKYGFCIIELHNGHTLRYVEMVPSSEKPFFNNSDMTLVGTFKESDIARYDTSHYKYASPSDDDEPHIPSSFNPNIIGSMRNSYYGSHPSSCVDSEEERNRLDRQQQDEADSHRSYDDRFSTGRF
jgi:hypothetical protein